MPHASSVKLSRHSWLQWPSLPAAWISLPVHPHSTPLFETICYSFCIWIIYTRFTEAIALLTALIIYPCIVHTQAYQWMKIDNPKNWVEFWRRQAKWFQQNVKYWAQPGMAELVRKLYEKDPMIDVLDSHHLGGAPQRYRSQAKEAQSRAEGAQSQIRPAELQLRTKISLIIRSS